MAHVLIWLHGVGDGDVDDDSGDCDDADDVDDGGCDNVCDDDNGDDDGQMSYMRLPRRMYSDA